MAYRNEKITQNGSKIFGNMRIFINKLSYLLIFMLVNLSCNGEEMIAIHDVSTSRTKLILNVIKNNEIIQKINYEYPTESFENAVFVEKKFEIIDVNKEKIYQLDTTKLTVEKVKTIVWRYTFAYYNTKRVTTVNPDGLPPVIYREKAAAKQDAA